jgi:glycerol-3-phosphate O-acyltransferase
VQFGEVIPFDAVRDSITKEDRELTPTEERALVQRIAHMTVHQIDRVTMVTPASLVATAILATPTGSFDRDTVGTRAQELAGALLSRNARFAPTLLGENNRLRDETLDEAIKLFMDAKLVQRVKDGPEGVYFVPDERRIALEYFKNNIIHFFVASALIAAAICDENESGAQLSTVKDRVARFSRLFKYEFMFRADASFDEIFRDALAAMIEHKELVRDGDMLRRGGDGGSGGGACISLYADTLKTYFESYRLAMRGAELLLEGGMSKKEWLKRTLSIGQRMYLSGELERRESVSKPRLENALRALHDMGVVRLDGERVESGPGLTGADSLEGIRNQFLTHASA